MNKTYLRGEMYYADLGRGIGSEQEGRRPVLILQNNTGNKYSPTVIVAAISSKVDAKAKLPTHYLLKAENGLELPSLVLLEQLRTIDKKRLETYIGRLEEKHIRRIDHAPVSYTHLDVYKRQGTQRGRWQKKNMGSRPTYRGHG